MCMNIKPYIYTYMYIHSNITSHNIFMTYIMSTTYIMFAEWSDKRERIVLRHSKAFKGLQSIELENTAC